MTSNSVSKLRLHMLLLGALVTTYVVSVTVNEGGVATCAYNPYQRSSNPDSDNTAPLSRGVRDFLAFHMVRFFLIGILGINVLTWSHDSYVRVRMFAVQASAYVVYFPSIFMVEYAKTLLSDQECSRKPNGISGHSFYFVWAILTAHYFAGVVRAGREKGSVMAACASVMSMLVLLCVGQQAVVTYVYGYHSLQQMFFGSILGVVHSALVLGVLTPYVESLLTTAVRHKAH
eukprot:GFYU01019838.1.p1 GENE.GFYU01019838.1~~GFYU01019838.1.p1  ORF type:complete len:231 (-),score=60.30 GFYU01019838.1:78-770(-)